MTELNEGQHRAEFLVSEANGTLSRETVTILQGQVLKAGHVLGKVSVGTASGAAAAGNTGNGTIGTVSTGDDAKPGVYQAVCIEPATDGGTFSVEDPNGVVIGTAVVGTPFAGEVNFAIADGGTDFAAGDRFTVTVAEGSGKYKEYDPANTDGSQTAAALLLDNVDATDGDIEAVAVLRQAEVNAAELVWFDSADANQKATALAQLKTQDIVAR